MDTPVVKIILISSAVNIELHESLDKVKWNIIKDFKWNVNVV